MAVVVGIPLSWSGVPVAAENGLFETGQFLLLLIGSALVFRSFVSNRALRPVLAFGTLFFLTLALRELDLRATGAPDWLVSLTFHDRGNWLTPLWIGTLIWAGLAHRQVSAALRGFDFRSARLALVPLVVVFALSYLFERRILWSGREVAQFMEEALELGLAAGLVTYGSELLKSLKLL